MKKSRVLIVDDEPAIRDLIVTTLAESFEVHVVSSGAECLQVAAHIRPSAILLDLRMPGEDGVNICHQLRTNPATQCIPILILTALADSEYKVNAFNNGADDFIPKPFRPAELLARVSSKVKRVNESMQKSHSPVLTFGNLKIHLTDLAVTIHSKPVDLGPVEFKILSLLARKHGELIKRQEIESYVWGNDRPSGRALDPHITSLRKKLQASDVNLKTVYGMGYSLIHRPN